MEQNPENQDDKKLALSKVQFSSDVSNKKVDIDFYHNRGKDSNLDLRALENLEKIEISDDTEELRRKKKNQKRKRKIRMKKMIQERNQIVYQEKILIQMWQILK